jgi:hypothetical protein
MPKKYGMRIIHTYDEAYQTGVKFIENRNLKHNPEQKNDTKLPGQSSDVKWEMSPKSLENTLRYIFELLHHQCYMVCVNNNNVLMCKLDMQSTAPVFREIIEKNTTEESLMENPHVTHQQSKYIREQVDKNIDHLRVMQCVVKPFAKSSSTVEKNNEYLELMRGLELPDGVFIFNLTDAVILRNDGKSPFTMVTGKTDLGEYNFDKHIPILSLSGQRNYLDIPIPNYDDVMYVLKTPNRFKGGKPDPNLVTDWEYKKYDKAVFRGGPTGCGYTELTNMRIKLAQMRSPLLDAKLSAKAGTETIDTKSIRFDPKYGLGMLNTSIQTTSNFLNMKEQSLYKYIIHIDGNVNAYRLLTTMTTGSLVLRVTSQYTSWVDHLIQHKVHYIPVKADLSDLLDVIRWCKNNDDRCREIAKNGREMAQSILSKQFIGSYLQRVLFTVASREREREENKLESLASKTPVKLNITRKSSPKVKRRAKTVKVRMTKEERAMEKERKDQEKRDEKERKEQEKRDEKERKEAEKLAEKERKEQEKQRKDAEKLAEKERKEQEKQRKLAEKLAKATK